MNRYDFNKKITEQSEEYRSTHDMLEEALDGQVYLKETFHKVNTNQVTGEALKKVSVGGKGGFGSQGDARDQEKQVHATSRVMVLSGPSQEAFDRNATLDKTVIGWDDKLFPIYMNRGETITRKVFNPSHLFGDKETKGWIEISKTLGRDYDEFVHSNQLDASDHQAMIEFMYMHCNMFGIKFDLDIQATRDRYDHLCGYKDAWKYVGINGAEHRRYRFTVGNLLNQDKYKPKKKAYKSKECYMTWEASSYNHHVVGPNWALYLECNPSARKDHVQHILHQLPTEKWDSSQERVYDNTKKVEPSEEFLKLKDAADRLERVRRLEAMAKSPKAANDWKTVYNWELTRNGKIKTFEK